MNPHRVQLSRKKGFRLPPNTVGVARPSIFGNPFKVMPYGGKWGVLTAFDIGDANGKLATGFDRFFDQPVEARGYAVELFRKYMKRRTLLATELVYLRGKNLACWCPLDQPCHADVLLELANPAK